MVVYHVDAALFIYSIYSTPLYLNTLYLHALDWQNQGLFAECIVLQRRIIES